MTEPPSRPRRIRPTRQDPQAVAFAREAKGWTQTALATEVGISKSLMCEIEKGTRGATPATLNRIAETLNCPVSILERRRETV